MRTLFNDGILHWIKTFQPQWIYENMMFCHGTPDSNYTYLTEQVTPDGAVSRSP
ncbi:hypothetical protein [Paenibacillus lacisoli]|uniref:hypothetical protein n=1 Tax=Paenibacillus lacisoli TaxID=3064525 RepID=UPI00272C1F01|nr:hypothetical protein [Paenibacillus sp. JX-17]